MTIELEGLSFAINWENVDESAQSLDSLSRALKKFNSDLGRSGRNVQRQADNVSALSNAINAIDPSRLDRVSQAMQALGQLNSFRVSDAAIRSLDRLATSLGSFNDADVDRAERIANALTRMSQAGPIPSLRRLREVESRQQETRSVDNSVTPPPTPASPPPVPSELSGVEEVALRSESALDRVKRRLSETGGAARQMVGRLRDLGSVAAIVTGLAHGFDQLKNGASRACEFMSRIGNVGVQHIKNELGNSVGNATGKVNQLVVALGRIAMYRAFRVIVSQVTQALKDGTTNLYYYSQLMSGTFASSMDNLATSALYLKNSFGAMAGPLIEAVTPAIDFVIGKIVELLNWFNQLIARLTGKSSWTRAVRQSKQFGTALSKGVGGGADKARGAVEKLRRSILGFDELNVLQDNDSSGSGGGSGGGGGGGAGTPDYGGMFEEVPFDDAISDFADKLKEAFNRQDWEGLGRLIGGKFNEIVDSIDWYGLGHKLGYGFDAVLKVVYFTLDEIDWNGLGVHFAELCNGVLDAWDTEYAGRLLAKKLTLVFDMILGFISEFNWGKLTQRMSEGFMGFMDEFSDFFEKYDWYEVGNDLWNAIRDAFLGLDFDGIASSFFRLLGNAFRTGIGLLNGFIGGIGQDFADWWSREIQGANWAETASNMWNAFASALGNVAGWVWTNIIDPFCSALVGNDAWNKVKNAGVSIWNNFTSGIKEFFSNPGKWIVSNMVDPFMRKILGNDTWSDIKKVGKDIRDGFYKGLGEVFTNPFQWIKENIVDPFVKNFKSAFGIHSPARVMIDPGKWVGKGILQGILNGLGSIGSWLREHLIDPMKKFLTNNPLGSLFNWLFGDKDGEDGADELNRLKNSNVLNLKVNLKKGNFKTVQKWLVPNGALTIPVNIDHSELDTLESALSQTLKDVTDHFNVEVNKVFNQISNVIINVIVNLVKGNFADVSSWVGNGAVYCVVYLIKGNFTTVSEWVGNGRVACYVDLVKGSGWDNLGNLTGGGGHFNGGGSGGSFDVGSSLTGGIFDPDFDWGFDPESFQKTMNDSIKASQAAKDAFDSIDIAETNIDDAIANITNGFKQLTDGITMMGDSSKDVGNGLKQMGNGAVTMGNAIAGMPNISVPDLSMNIPDIHVNIPDIHVNVPDINIPNISMPDLSIKLTSPDYIYIGLPVDTNKPVYGPNPPFVGGGGHFNGGGAGSRYATGGHPSHGSYFYAGESGPELVGHVGGHTEVMNKFQMASVMYDAVQNGMKGVRVAFPSEYVDMITRPDAIASETDLSEIESAIISTSARRNDLLKEQNELLRDLLNKESKAVITTSEITKALNRKNQRDGKTVVPIG